jgi:SpoVK/Ycf46/Vps4 family AAA+-type ATPase
LFYGPPGTGKTLVAGLIGKELGLDVCEVKSSNARYANLEVNQLLQRLDSFEGVAILTTNLDGSIDPAFKQRLSMRL